MASFTWDPAGGNNTGRFRDPSTGRYVPEARVLSGVEAVVSLGAERMRTLALALREGRLSTEAFQAAFLATIKDVQVSAALAAYGGLNAMDQSRWGYVGQLVRDQYQYARTLVGEVISGRQAMTVGLDYRATLYAANARVTYQLVRARIMADGGARYERNILNARESCESCRDASRRGWVALGSLPPVGSRTCRANCRCTIEYRTARPALGLVG